MFSFICRAQTDTIIKKDTSKFILKPFNPYLFNVVNNSSPNIFSHNYSLKNTSTLFDLRYESQYIRQFYYNNFINSDNKMLFIYKHHFYYVKDPVHPYGMGRNALFLGSLNYLFLLFARKNK